MNLKKSMGREELQGRNGREKFCNDIIISKVKTSLLTRKQSTG